MSACVYIFYKLIGMEVEWSMKKCIMLVHSSLVVGGAEKMIVYLANLLSDKYRVIFVMLENKESNFFLSDNVRIVNLHYDSYMSTRVADMSFCNRFLQLKNIINDLRHIIKNENVDLVVAFKSRETLFSFLATRFIDTKLLLSQRGDPRTTSSVWNLIYTIAYNLCNGVVFQLDAVRKYYMFRSGHSCVIPNPSFEVNIPYTGEKKKILAAGRFCTIKRHDILIKAFAVVVKKYPDYELYLYGANKNRDDEYSNLKALAESLGISDKVFFKDAMKDVIINNLDAEMFVFSSESEGIPNILIEALSSGIPCIATNCSPGGAAFLLNNGENGLLVEKNSVIDLAAAMIKYITNRELAVQYGEKGKLYMKNFTEDIISEKWLNYISKVLKNKIM